MTRRWTVIDADGSRLGMVWALVEPTGEELESWRTTLRIAAAWSQRRQQLEDRVLARMKPNVFSVVPLFDLGTP